jgi:biopolymer transport protein TolR
VPFIDVMLVLLIIFMVTAPLIAPSQIDLPSVGQASRQPERFVQVIVNKSERLQVMDGNGKTEGPDVPMGQLVARVKQLQGKGTTASVPVVISADKNVKYETVVRVMDTLQRAGVTRVGLSVQTTR